MPDTRHLATAPKAQAARAAARRGSGGSGSPLLEVAEDNARQKQELSQLSEAIAAAEREGGYDAAQSVFEVQSQSMGQGNLWRVHLELAECAKRGAALPHVKKHLAQALKAQPRAVQVWLEACRTLDELGELEECRTLLEQGLECCAPSEQLCLKMARVLERLGDQAGLRAMVGSLRREAPERTCKVLLEAAHCEVRAGNGEAVRQFLRCLMLRIPHQGPLYSEACRIEGILGKWQTAMSIAEHGVQTCAKYGPLWFVLLHQVEKAYGAWAVKDYATVALKNICLELHWKVHFEVAAAFGRCGSLSECRRSIGLAALSCPRHLRWKVWLLAARSELWDGSVEASRRLLTQARSDAPSRVQVAVCIERARSEEYLGGLEAARAALKEAHACEGHDWKVFLEHIFMEARHGCLQAAKDAAIHALELHPATGRLWSALIALEHSGEGGADGAMAMFRKAVREVPKSGEVWCEGARVFLNPLGLHFHLGRAQRCLEFAVHLTPQYGDSFLELLRLRFLLELQAQMLADPLVRGVVGAQQATLKDNSRSGNLSAGQKLALATLAAKRACATAAGPLQAGRFEFRSTSGNGDPAAESSSHQDSGMPQLHLARLAVLCAYADPNYGFLWFWCRESALSSPNEVLARMREEVSGDLVSGGALAAYALAIAGSILGVSSESITSLAAGSAGKDGKEANALGSLMPTISAGPEATSDYSRQSSTADPTGGPTTRDFALGSLRLSRCFACSTATLELAERRRLIFGSDILCV